jgi:hypothetical protein
LSGWLGTIKLYSGFFLKETVCRQPCKQVYQKVYRTAAPGMFNLADVFQFIVNCFNNRAFPEKYFIPDAHQAIFHIAFDTGNQVQSILKKQFAQGCRNIAFVTIELAEQFFTQGLNDRPLPVVHMGGSNAEIEQFAFVIDHQMEFESVKPSHRAFAGGCRILKTRLRLMRLFLHTAILVESIKVMPVHSPKQMSFKNRTNGIMTFRSSSTKRL